MILWSGAAAAEQPSSIDGWVREEMARQHIPGAAVAVIQHGKVAKIQGYGFANLEHRIPVTATTVFKIGSVSKQFLATGIMLLAQDGKLQPSDPVAQHIPEAPAAWEGITLRHLLTHTSGLVREGPGFDGLRIQADSSSGPCCRFPSSFRRGRDGSTATSAISPSRTSFGECPAYRGQPSSRPGCSGRRA